MSTAPSETRTLGAVVGLNFFSDVPINIAPLLTGALIDRLHLSTTAAGILGGVELLAFAAPPVLLSRLAGRVSARTLGAIGLISACGANIASAYCSEIAPLVALRAVAGAGAGLCLLAASATVATAARVDRVASIAACIVSALIAVAIFAAAAALGAFGTMGLFLMVAVCAALAAPALLLTPSSASRGDTGAPSLGAVMRSPIVLVATSITVGAAAVWAFSERVGVGIGMSHAMVAGVIAATAFAGVAGGFAAALLARPGREWTLAFWSIALFGLACVLLPLMKSSPYYIAAMLMLTFFFVFSRPFITALAVRKDPSGGLAAAAYGLATLFSAGAPPIAGYLVRDGNLAMLAWAPAIATPFALVALFAMRRSINSHVAI